MPFEVLELGIIHGGSNQVWVSALSRLGAVHGVPVGLPAKSDFTPEALHGHVQRFGDAVRRGERNLALAIQFSDLLRHLVFDIPDLHALFEQTRGAAADKGRSLLVRVQAAPRLLAALPWELMPDPVGGPHRFLTLAPDAHVARLARARTYPVRTTPLAPPLRLLLILASPVDERSEKATSTMPPPENVGAVPAPFDVYEEKRALMEALDPLVAEGLLEVDVEDRPTLENLRSRVARRPEGYHLIHYVGFADPSGPYLEDSRGWPVQVRPDQFIALFRGCADLRLIVFAGCETARGAETPAESWPEVLSLADLCVRDLCPTVLAMQAVLPFHTEKVFSRIFYQALASGRDVAAAVALGRSAVRDDVHVGERLDWAVPSLFFGGQPLEVLIDRSKPVTRLARRPREELKIDFDEGERDYFARHGALRKTIDFLTGRKRARVLWVYEAVGEQTRLIDRALDDVGDAVQYVLSVPVRRLLAMPDPILELCRLVKELLGRRDSKLPDHEPQWKGIDWWARLVESVISRPFVLVLDDQDAAPVSELNRLEPVVHSFIRRRTLARLVLVSPAHQVDPPWKFLPARLDLIKLRPIGFDDVLLWLRRNLPSLSNFHGKALNRECYPALGTNFAQWEALAELANQPAGSSASLADLVAQTVAAATPRPAARPAPEPGVGKGSGLRVACIGRHIEGRQKEFAEALTLLADEWKVGGRVVSDTERTAVSLAYLLPVPSPFKDDNVIDQVAVVEWMQRSLKDGAQILLLDLDAPLRSEILRDFAKDAIEQGAFLLGCAGKKAIRSYPGWLPEVFAVGGLAAAGRLAPHAHWEEGADKPDLFALDTVQGTALEPVIRDANQHGPSFAALHVLAAVVLVWATDRRLTAEQVGEVLRDNADPLPHPLATDERSPRELNLAAALRSVRVGLIREALRGRALDQDSLVAACPLPKGVTVQLAEDLTQEGILRRTAHRGIERYSLNLDQANEELRAVFRKETRSSIAIAPITRYESLDALLETLPSDASMRGQDLRIDSTTPRVAEENRNVEIKSCFLHAIKREMSNDIRLILGNGKLDEEARFLIANLSALPPAGQSRDKLRTPREQFREVFGTVAGLGYKKLEPPVPVGVTGSLFYSTRHPPGTIGPLGLRPATAWYIQPVTDLVFDPERAKGSSEAS